MIGEGNQFFESPNEVECFRFVEWPIIESLDSS